MPDGRDAATAAAEEAGRAGPLADALLRETVSALHAELEQRSGREAALEGALERARAELVARTASQAELEATHARLRTELARLVEAVAEQQAEFERRLERGGVRGPRRSWRRRAARPTTRAVGADRRRATRPTVPGRRWRRRAAKPSARGPSWRRRVTEADRARAELADAREQEAGIVHTRQQLAAVNERLAAAAGI